jgi:citrate synthase
VERVEWPVATDVAPGLRGVIAAATRVMWLDPSSGRLAYRGEPIESLALEPDFERTAFLLIRGRPAAEDPAGWDAFRDSLRAGSRIPDDVIALVRDMDPATHPTRLLRAGVSALGCHELSAEDDLAGDRHWREFRILGQVAELVCEIIRFRRGLEPRGGCRGRESLAERLLASLGEASPDAEDVRLLDLLWVLYAANGLAAPAFTSLIVASCLADPYYNVVAGLSALRGPREGGAAESVVRSIVALDDAAAAEDWVRRTVAAGRRIPGFGHPEYRMPDPRVVLLRKAAATAARRTDRLRLYEVARAVEDAATRELAPRGVHVNVNLYGALLFHLLGADAELVPCLIAAARTAAFVALVRESLDSIRLYRPRGRYVGPPERSVPSRRTA